VTGIQGPGERAVRMFFQAYSESKPELFDECVSADYLDFGHTPPGRGPDGARDDFNQAQAKVGSVTYEIASLVDDGDEHVAAHWLGHLANGTTVAGLSLYRVVDGKIASTHHTAEGGLPPA
jgi:ketosteroid isomerase-like protein